MIQVFFLTRSDFKDASSLFHPSIDMWLVEKWLILNQLQLFLRSVGVWMCRTFTSENITKTYETRESSRPKTPRLLSVGAAAKLLRRNFKGRRWSRSETFGNQHQQFNFILRLSLFFIPMWRKLEEKVWKNVFVTCKKCSQTSKQATWNLSLKICGDRNLIGCSLGGVAK